MLNIYFVFYSYPKGKTEKQLMQEIETGPSLKPTETKEKNPLPTKEDIAAEKATR
ncbi:unnamed protein product [Heterobilharzia americana]|nr:unnamed protein product [Heterobilharzia americana]